MVPLTEEWAGGESQLFSLPTSAKRNRFNNDRKLKKIQWTLEFLSNDNPKEKVKRIGRT